jgi:Spy/CpxP family protein refolding chaperone
MPMPRAETTRTLRRRFAAVLACVLAGGLLLPLDATADPGKGRGKGPRQDKGGRFVRMLQENAQRLGLDETSLREIESVAAQDRDAIQALRAREESEERVMRELLEKRTPDESAVMRQAEVLGDIDTEQDKLRLRTMIRVRQLLTPEQLAELSKLREEKRKERKERRGRWRDRE